MSYYYDRVIGLDLGNGLVNIRSVHKNGKKYLITLPSAYVKKSSLGESVEGDYEVEGLDFFNIEGIEYAWGKEGIEDIKDESILITTNGYQGRYISMAFKRLAKMALAKAYTDLKIKPSEKVLVVTGTPSEEFRKSANKDLVNAIKGTHDLEVNGEKLLFKIDAVESQSQPIATVFSMYLGEDGYVENEEFEDMKVGVIDIGGGTTDYDVVDKFRRQNVYVSRPKGFQKVYETIRKAIATINPLYKPTDYNILNAINEANKKALKDGGEVQYLIRTSQREPYVNFTNALNVGLSELAEDIESTVIKKWESQTGFDYIFLVGGSASMFEDKIPVVSGFTIPEDSGTTNVEGYFRWGMALSIEKEEELREEVSV